MLVRYFAIWLVFMMLGETVTAQQVISGVVSTKNTPQLENVSVVLYAPQKDEIIAYAVSDEKGRYQIAYTFAGDSVRLQFSFLGYQKQEIKLSAKRNQVVHMVLTSESVELPTVVVKDQGASITTHGDTLNYSVKAFSDKSDRVIIDVLKKLPGITVTDRGQILYQDRAINKFYVDGKDLLDSKYNIATNNLPNGAVDMIQVLKDHQPIQMLNGVIPSDRAAINIKLNKEGRSKLLGNGSIAVGIPLLQRNTNVTLLKFDPRVQFINSIKSNNIGIDLADELTDHFSTIEQFESGTIKQDLIALIKTEPPNIAKERYHLNDNTLINGNYLTTLSPALELKSNISYLNNRTKEYTNKLTQIFLANDTIRIPENQEGKNQSNSLSGALSLNRNDDKRYFRESLKFQRVWEENFNTIYTNGIDQRLKNPFLNLSNEVSGLIRLKRQLIGYSSFASYNSHPQRLQVEPGQLASVVNNSVPYQRSIQQLVVRNFYTNNAVSLNQTFGRFTLTHKAGFTIHLQTLENELHLVRNEVSVAAPELFNNAVQRNRVKIYNDLNAALQLEKLSFNLALQSSVLLLKNKGKAIDQFAMPLVLNPLLQVRFKLNQFWHFQTTLFESKSFTYEANPTFILENYRTLANNITPLKRIQDRGVGLRTNYANIVNGIFGYGSFNYTAVLSNILLANQFDGFVTTKTAIEGRNPSYKINMALNISKYVADLKTLISITVRYDDVRYQQIQQSVVSQFNNKAYTYEAALHSRLGKVLTLDYHWNYLHLQTIDRHFATIRRYDPVGLFKQQAVAKVFLPGQLQVNLQGDHYLNQTGKASPLNYIFIDGKIQKTFKSKIDVSMMLKNLGNVTSYSSYTYADNYLIGSDYRLRGRIFMASVGFQF